MHQSAVGSPLIGALPCTRHIAPIAGCLYCPVPLAATVWGLLLALSDSVSVAVRVPFAAGLNVTEMVHLPFAGTLPAQVFVSAKSPGSAPVNEIPLME